MKRTLLVFLEDVFLLPRIQDVARSAGFQLQHIAGPQDLGIDGEPAAHAIPLTEPLDGPEAVLVRRISALGPAIIMIDAGMKSLPWVDWIQVLKTSAATRRIPILVFGPHVDKNLLDRARSHGADVVVTRGTFNKRLLELITQHSHPDPTAELIIACAGELTEKGRKGIDLHNRREFYQAHELLERAWMEAPEKDSYLYRALLQFTVACLHLERGNLRGARKMLLRIHHWLDPLPDICQTVDVGRFKQDVSRLRQALEDQSSPLNLPPAQIQLVS